MSREITHTPDPDTGHLVQRVTPARLRQILDADGESYEPPGGFGPNDEWCVDGCEWTGEIVEARP